MSKQAAGVFFYSKSTQRYLYLLRSDQRSPTWSIPGGGIEQDETLLEGIERECNEEMGFNTVDIKLIPIQKFVNNAFVYHTFFCEVEEEFIPTLNDEHSGYAWCEFEAWPKPLHQGVKNSFNNKIIKAKLELMLELI